MPRRAIGRLLAAKPRSDFHLILRNTSLAMAGFLFRPLSRVPFLFIVARLYGEAAFGRYVFAVGVFEALAAAARLGLRDTLFRFMAEDGQEPNGVLVDCLVVGAGLAALVALVVTLGSPVFGRLGASELWPSLRALAPLLPFYVLTDILLAATRAQRTVRYEVAARSLVEPALLTLGAGGLAWLGLKGGLLAAYLVAQLATLGVAVFGVARLYPLREIPRPNWSRMRRIAAQSAPTGLADCMNLAFLATGVVAVGHFLGDARLGIYGMAQNLETALSKIRQAFDMVVVPMVSQWMTDRSDGIVDQLRGVGRWILSAQLPVFVVILLLGDRLLGLLGKSFSSGAAVLSLLALAAVVDGTANLAQVPLFLRRPRLNSAIAAGMLATHIGLSFVLVPRLGLAGAGVSMAVAVTAAGLLRQLEIRRLFGRWLVNAALLKPIAAAAVGFAVAKLITFVAPPNALWRGVSVTAFLAGYGLLLVAMEPDLRRRLTARTLSQLVRR